MPEFTFSPNEPIGTLSTRGVFVTGTDTSIGKTLVSAILVKAWNAVYWKPFQTGLADEPGDTPEVARLAQCASGDILPPAYALRAPLSPMAAARSEGVALAPETLTLPKLNSARPLVVEGAGGLMVPLAPSVLMIDLIARFRLPVILVARGALGTLNHTLLSLEALKRRGIGVAGVVFSGGDDAQEENKELVEAFSSVRCLFSLPRLEHVTPAAVAVLAAGVPAFKELHSTPAG